MANKLLKSSRKKESRVHIPIILGVVSALIGLTLLGIAFSIKNSGNPGSKSFEKPILIASVLMLVPVMPVCCLFACICYKLQKNPDYIGLAKDSKDGSAISSTKLLHKEARSHQQRKLSDLRYYELVDHCNTSEIDIEANDEFDDLKKTLETIEKIEYIKADLPLSRWREKSFNPVKESNLEVITEEGFTGKSKRSPSNVFSDSYSEKNTISQITKRKEYKKNSFKLVWALEPFETESFNSMKESNLEVMTEEGSTEELAEGLERSPSNVFSDSYSEKNTISGIELIATVRSDRMCNFD